MTNDHGEYRLFSLAPGDYYVEFQGQQTLYFPKALTMDKAEKVNMMGGREATGINFIALDSPGVTLRGQLTGTLSLSRLPVFSLISADARILKEYDNGTVPVSNFSVDPATRKFEIRRVPPGTYELVAKVLGNETPEQQGYYRASHTIYVTNEDVQNVLLDFNPNINVIGHIDTAGSSGAHVIIDPDDVFLRNLYIRPDTGWRDVIVDNNGTFRLPNTLQGHYSIKIALLPQNNYLSDVRAAGASILSSHIVGIDLLSQSNWQVIVKADAGVVAGMVQTEKSQPIHYAKVVLMSPADSTKLPMVYETAYSDAQGNYSLPQVAPGIYRVVAFQETPRGAELNPEFLSHYEKDSKPVTVQSNVTAEVNLRALATR